MLNPLNLETNSLPWGTNTSSDIFGNTSIQRDLTLPVTQLGGSSNQNLVFIDSNLAETSILSSSFENAEVFLLNPNIDGIAQITNVLAQYQNVASVHIVSHGNAGDVLLGNSHLNLANISNYSSHLQSWSHALTTDADVLLYGCNVAAGGEGQSFIQQLSQITGADIAASSNLTGNQTLDGDWNLEVATGQIESADVLNHVAVAKYDGLLETSQTETLQSGDIGLETSGIKVNEIDKTASVTILRQNGSDGTVTVDYSTFDGSATAGTDYTAQSGTLTFAPGETSKSVTISIIDDSLPEDSETFGFAIDNIIGGTSLLGTRTAEITIVDNEKVAGLVGYWKLDETSIGAQVVDSSSFNNNGQHTNMASPSGPSTNTPVLNFDNSSSLNFDGVNDYVNVPSQSSLDLSGGTFTQSVWIYSNITDNAYHGVLGYQPAAGTSQRYPGIWVYQQTKIHAGFGDGTNWNAFTTGNVLKAKAWNNVVTSFDGTNYKVYVNAKEVFSTDEFAQKKPYATQQVDIGRVDNYFKGQIDDVRIYNRTLDATEIQALYQDQPATQFGEIGLQTSTITVSENKKIATVTVLRQNGSDGTVTVDYSTLDGSATAGTDYIAQSGTLTFAPEETSKSVTISIIDDGVPEDDETLSFAIDNVNGGATLLAPRTAQIKILDKATGLVGYWNLDENSIDTQVVDSSGFDNNGQHTNMVSPSGPSTNTPILNVDNSYSLNFDGVNDYVNVPSQSSLDLSGGTFTQSVWIYSDITDNAYHGVLGYQPAAGTSQRYPGIWVYQQTKIHAGFGDGTNWNAFTTGNVLTAKAWNNVVTSFDGTTYKAYVNGNEVFSTDEFAQKKPYATQQVHIGRVDNYFKGQIDDVRIYNRTLDATEIQALYQDQAGNVIKGTIVSGLTQPTAIEWTPDGQTMLVAQKNGVVKVMQNGSLLSTPFIDISQQVNNNGDRGLLDLAIHADFPHTPYVYLLFTYDPPEVYNSTTDSQARPDGGGNRAGRLIRVTADASTNYTTALPDSEVVLLGKNSTWNNYNGFVDSTVDFDEPPAGILANGENLQDFLAADSRSHSIGTVEFGPDGALYVSNGDGTSYNRVDSRTVRVQDIDNLSGKVLRIDPITGQGLSDNPFYNGDPDSNRSKVYQYGFRNPFRLTINPQSGKLYVGDVGWGTWEEVNSAGAGANFGWPYYEGGDGVSLQARGYRNLAAAQDFYASGEIATPAILGLNHAATGINAIVLGDVYTGTKYPEKYWGDLFFNDLGQGIVRNISFDANGNIEKFEPFVTGAKYVVQIQMGPDGNLYYVDLDDGLIGRWLIA